MALTQNWVVRKPGVASRGGIVASQNGVAATAGADILAAGGTAVDAVVATAFALSVREPWNSGLGGVGFMVVHPPGATRAEIVDFGPIAPRGLDPSAFKLTGETASDLFTWPQVEGDRNVHGPLSIAVPSAVRGYALALERFGRTPWRDLLAPAIALAKQGLPVDWYVTLKVATEAETLRRYDESRRIYLPNGLPPVGPAAGDPPSILQGRLADTLARLAECGPDDFYAGDIARAIVADIAAGGGFLSADDLAGCRARTVPSLDIPYRSVTFQAARGLTAAPTLADVLDRLSSKSFAGAPDATYFESIVDALQQAYAARLEGLGDVQPGSEESCTTHITAVDRDGGVAALTTTLLSSFGSRYVLPQTGILMNNGIMWFDPRPGRPNSMAPGKRALNNMCPLIVARDGRPRFGVGASGGRRILAAVLQMASFIVDFGMTPEEAAHHPRVDVSGDSGVTLDRRLLPAVLDRLGNRPGAALVEHTVWPQRFACPNLVLRGEDGLNYGISDAMTPWSAAIAEPGKDA
ncbi:MAG TPA: gamma-glutamyltransferase [Stellaceae bacterium]|jgi:gamma-glutamyltranspeptidase/glutathione hydrolase|nr:gamma-glutamyltransferase [Stellaceae bacterium]